MTDSSNGPGAVSSGLVQAGGVWAGRGPGAAAVALDLSRDDAERLLAVEVERLAGRPPGHAVGQDAETLASLALLGVGPLDVLARADKARNELRTRLAPLARSALAGEVALDALKRGVAAAHAGCFNARVSSPGSARCDTACLKALAAWRGAIDKAGPGRQALAKLRELAVAVPAKMRETEARGRLAAARSAHVDARTRLRDADDELARVAHERTPVAAGLKAVRVVRERELADAAAALSRAEVAHAQVVAERLRLRDEVDASLRAQPEVTAQKKHASKRAT